MINKLLIYSIILLIGYFIVNTLFKFDLNKRVYNHRPGHCQEVKGINHGSEHIEYVAKENLAFLSSGVQGLKEVNGSSGEIYLYDLSERNPNHEAVKLKITNQLVDFIPHGMGHYFENGELYLVVIAHTPINKGFQHSIEIFGFNREGLSLTHVKTIRDKNFIRPNGMIAIGPEQFFITNDAYSQSDLPFFFEMLFGFKWGSVVYYDGKKSHVLVSSEFAPNGIWVDTKKRILYYSSPFGEMIRVVQLSQDFTSVKGELARIDLLTSPDNLFMDDQGALWTGAHPVLHKLAEIDNCFEPRKGSNKVINDRPPSQVLRIKFSDDFKTHEITEPYTDDGRQIPCSSHAIVDGKGNMLIGSVGWNTLHCKYTPETILAH